MANAKKKRKAAISASVWIPTAQRVTTPELRARRRHAGDARRDDREAIKINEKLKARGNSSKRQPREFDDIAQKWD